MIAPDPLRRPLAFLARFAVAAGALYLLRSPIARVYLALVAPPATWLLGDGGARYVRVGHELSLVYADLGLRFTVHDVVYQNLLVAMALFAATPAPWRWRVGWGSAAVAALWASHVVSLYLGGHVIVWDYVLSLPPALGQDLALRVAARWPVEQDWLLSRLFGLWHTWGRQCLALGVWALAVAPLLRGPGPSPGAGDAATRPAALRTAGPDRSGPAPAR